MNYKLLIVDDEPSNLRALDRLLSRSYTVLTAESGAAGLELIRQHDFAAIISDHRMPVMTGIEFLKKAAELRHQTVRILLTGYTDVETLVDAINSGAIYQYLTKPWNNDDLLQTMRRALEHHLSIKETHRTKFDLERLIKRQEIMQKCFLRCWDELIRLKDPQLCGHSARMSEYARIIAATIEVADGSLQIISSAARMLPFIYGPSTIARVIAGGPVSDESVLRLSEDLYRAMDIMSEFDQLEDFREIAETMVFSNEHFDGSGFPERLAGDRIPMSARIVAAARAYDLVTSVGLHGRKLDHEQAIGYLSSGVAERFDPEVIGAMTRFSFVSSAAHHVDGTSYEIPTIAPLTSIDPRSLRGV